MQYVLKNGPENFKEKLLEEIKNNFYLFSKNKFARLINIVKNFF